MDATSRQAPPVRCATLAELVEVAAGDWVEPFGAGELVKYPLTVEMGTDSELRDYLASKARAQTPARGLARLPAARVYGAGVVLSGDGSLIARDVSEDFGKGVDQHWLIGHGSMRRPLELTGETAVVAVNRGAGYCHWLLEELPRLLALPKGAVEHVIAHMGTEPMLTAWKRRGGAEKPVEARRNTHLAVGPLWVPALAAQAGAPTPGALQAIREFAEGLGRADTSTASMPGAAGAGERVYISRARAARRRVKNEDELWRALQAAGFARVFLEELAWAEQIAIAQTARVIVSPHGAGLANMVFSLPGTRVVELVNRAYFNPVFWRLAALAGLDYRPVVTDDAASGAIREEQTRNKEDFRVNVARVMAALSKG